MKQYFLFIKAQQKSLKKSFLPYLTDPKNNMNIQSETFLKRNETKL